jgi:hypothetical protein
MNASIREGMKIQVETPFEAVIKWGKLGVKAYISKEQPKTDLENKIYNEWKLCAGRHEHRINSQPSEESNPENWPQNAVMEIKIKGQFTYQDDSGTRVVGDGHRQIVQVSGRCEGEHRDHEDGLDLVGRPSGQSRGKGEISGSIEATEITQGSSQHGSNEEYSCV